MKTPDILLFLEIAGLFYLIFSAASPEWSKIAIGALVLMLVNSAYQQGIQKASK